MSRHARFAFRDAAGLTAAAARLGVSIPYRERTGVLFQPLELPGGRRLANRLAVHPMEGADGTEEGAPGELTFRRYNRFAAGGCGLIWFEATAVEPGGRSNPRQLLMTKRTAGEFRRLVDETRAAARASRPHGENPLLVLQLTHSGRFSKPKGVPEPLIAQHNPWLDPFQGIGPDDPIATDAKLDGLKDSFVEAAGLAARAGFDGVDIKACHGYLLGELLAARGRPDSLYGGDFENRMRFLIETVAAVRGEFPALLVASRLGIFDGIPYPLGFGADNTTAHGESLSEPIALIGRLAAAGLGLLNVTVGIPAWKAHFGRPFDKPAAGGALPDEHPLEGVARLIRIAGEVQGAHPGIPVVGTGYSWLRKFMPHVAAGVLEEGRAALVGLGRLSFAYPDLARDLRDRGGLDPKRLCTACSGCTDLLRAGRPAGCVVRDKTVYKKIG